LPRPVQPHLHVPLADAERLGDLVVAQPAQRAEHQDIAVGVGKFPNFATDAVVHVLVGELLFGGRVAIDSRRTDCRGAHAIVRCIRKRNRQFGFLRRPAAQPVGGDIHCNSVKPRRRFCITAEGWQRFGRFREYRLSQVVGFLRTNNTCKDTPNALMVRIIQPPKRVCSVLHIRPLSL
jgi:hypothetical protein